MTSALCDAIQLFIKNTQAIKDELPFQGSMMRRAAALLYTGEGREIDCARIRGVMRLIKSSTGIFSMFRSSVQLCLAAMLSLHEEPEKLLKEVLIVYRLLKSSHFHARMYLVFAAYQIAITVPQDAQQKAVARTRIAYESVRRAHPFLTGEHSVMYAALIGSCAVNAEEAMAKAERLFLELNELSPKSEVLNLAMLLALSNGMDPSSRVLQIYDALNTAELSFRRRYLLPILGALALSPLSPNFIAANIAETASSLRAQKGFGPFFVAKQELLLMSSSLVIYAQPSSREPLNTALLGGLTSMLVAQQVALAASVSAAAAAASSSSS